MASLNHPHLTKIIGIHAVEDVKIFTLFREHGSLLDFLQRKKNTLGSEDLVRYAFQISQVTTVLLRPYLDKRTKGKIMFLKLKLLFFAFSTILFF